MGDRDRPQLFVHPWNRNLETGIQLLDGQHRDFLKRYNRFVIEFLTGKEPEAVMAELEYMQNFILYHFQTEETFLIDSGYSGYPEHQAEHKGLVFKVKEAAIHLSAQNGGREATALFYDFLGQWLEDHLMGSDMEFAKFYIRELGRSDQ